VTPTRSVFAAAALAVVVAIALICAGVAILAGTGWTLIAAGALIGPTAVGGAWVLLRDAGEATG